MKDRSSKSSIRVAFAENFHEVVRAAGSAGGNDRYVQAIGHGASEFAIETGSGAVTIHGGEENFTGTTGFGLQSPIQGVASRGHAASVGEGVPGSVLTFGIDGDHDGLRAEASGDAGNEGGIGEGSGVDADFVSSGGEYSGRVIECADATTDREGDEKLAGSAADGIEQGGPLLVSCRDVEEDDFVCAGLAVRLGEFGGVSGVAEVDELNAFDDASGVNVEAGDNAFGQHSQRAQKLLRIFSPALPDFSGWNWTPKR